MSERAAPFYCPYCADEGLRPFGETHGEWRCGACRRVFKLNYIGVAMDWTSEPDSTSKAAEESNAEHV